MDFNKFIESAEEIQATRKFQAIEQANQENLSEEESLELFIDASLGSIQVYAISFSISLRNRYYFERFLLYMLFILGLTL